MLEFFLKHGHRLQHRDWFKKLKAEGRIAKDMPEEPEVMPTALWMWNAFNRLTTQRQYGERGPQPIAISEIKAYAELYELSFYHTLRLVEVVLKLDRMYVDHKYRELAAEKKKAGTKGKGKRGR